MPDARPRSLLIGVGNRDRGDDGVGPALCDRVSAHASAGVEVLVFEGSVLDLPMHWEPHDRVVIVDAAAPAGEPGRVGTVDVVAHRLAAPGSLSTHSIDVGAAIELARTLDRLPAELTIIGIEGVDFDHGSPLSPAVARAADRVETALRRWAGGSEPVVGEPESLDLGTSGADR